MPTRGPPGFEQTLLTSRAAGRFASEPVQGKTSHQHAESEKKGQKKATKMLGIFVLIFRVLDLDCPNLPKLKLVIASSKNI